MINKKTILITGGLGFLGSNLANHALREGHKVICIDNFLKHVNTTNLNWLKKFEQFIFESKDIRIKYDVENVIKKYQPDVIFHAAGQVAMTTSIENPLLDFETNALGTLHVLESVRHFSPKTIIIFSSTNKVYGDLDNITYIETDSRYTAKDYPEGFDENTQLEFHSPYGCSKGTADQYLLDYHRIYGLNTVVFRHSSMYGDRQFSTFDQGWIGWFVEQALRIQKGEIKEIEIHGTGKQVRDVLYADDMVNLYFKTVDNIEKCSGQAFNIGGGMKNSISLLELFEFLEKELNIKIEIKNKPWRESDQKVFVANISKINHLIGWTPKIGKEEGIRKMIKWVARENEDTYSSSKI